MKYYIKEDYYFDIDSRKQLRITGPENHLFFGITFPKGLKVKILDYYMVGKQLEIKLELPTDKVVLTVPLVTDIRTLRSFTENAEPTPSYNELVVKGNEAVVPHSRQTLTKKGNHLLRFLNNYVDERGRKRYYGAYFLIPKKVKVNINENILELEGKATLTFKIRTISNIFIRDRLLSNMFVPQQPLPSEYFSPYLIDLYNESERNISFLIRTKKTSSFEYGTIFPRDWIESADLGEGDLSENTIDYMYKQSMLNISEKGEGWHEDVVGEFRTKLPDKSKVVDRKMIDIEPHYILGMERVSKNFLTRRNNQKKIRLVANYLLEIAKQKDLITFKRMSDADGEYHQVGNWRDSYYAYPQQKAPLAPYDVNCVFYPESIKVIKKYNHFFKVKDTEELSELIHKWEANKQKFRLYHKNDLQGYSLALHGKKNVPLPMAHLDECYDLFYGTPNMEEVVSFSQKIIDPDYFFTPVGPILVATDEDLFTTANYHGKVIWPKQAAFAVAGLAQQFRRGLLEEWPQPVLDNIKNSIIVTARACFKGWTDLGAVPELYYYDSLLDKARFYTDQPTYEGQMSMIQLWSSVGARRIMREYAFIMTGELITG